MVANSGIHFLLLFIFFTSICNSLDKSESVENKIKLSIHCWNFIHAVCCVEDIGIFASGTRLSFYNPSNTFKVRDDKSFEKVVVLQGLDISHLNELTALLRNKHIEVLKVVGSSRLTFIGQSAFSQYSNLRILDLSHNSLTFQHPSEIHAFAHTNIFELNLSYNQIETTDTLMTALGHLKKPSILYLNNNRKLQLGKDGFPPNLGSLDFLDLSYCNIWNLSDSTFNHLINLKTLHLEGNALSTIPKSLCTRHPSLKIFLASTHIDKSQQKYLQEHCTVTMSFELLMPPEKEFQIVYDDKWYKSTWFYLFIVFSLIIIGLVFFIFWLTRSNVIRQKLISYLEVSQ